MLSDVIHCVVVYVGSSNFILNQLIFPKLRVLFSATVCLQNQIFVWENTSLLKKLQFDM